MIKVLKPGLFSTIQDLGRLGYQDLGVPYSGVMDMQAAKIAKGSGEPNREKVGEVTRKQVEEIAKLKFEDLNAYDLENAVKIIEGTARSMGITVAP